MCPLGHAGDEPDSSMQTLRDAYYFLQENGYINFGVLKGVSACTQLFQAQADMHHLCVSVGGSCCLQASPLLHLVLSSGACV
jgi:hypothetical protein